MKNVIIERREQRVMGLLWYSQSNGGLIRGGNSGDKEGCFYTYLVVVSTAFVGFDMEVRKYK